LAFLWGRITMPHAGAEEKPRYGMDASGDGMMDKAELDAYYAVKAQAEADLAKEQAIAAAARTASMAANASQYETVPGFAARRGWDGNTINEHNYAESLTKETAVFPYREVSHGPMAQFLERPPSPPKDNQAPRGRSRTGPDFFAPPRVQ